MLSNELPKLITKILIAHNVHELFYSHILINNRIMKLEDSDRRRKNVHFLVMSTSISFHDVELLAHLAFMPVLYRNFAFLGSSCVSVDSFLYAQLILYANNTELMLLCI